MSILERIDGKIWIEEKTSGDDFLQIDIFSHSENFNNNGDKYLVVLSSPGGQGFKGVFTNISQDIEGVNSEKYDLNHLDCLEEIAFVIVGNCEISSFKSAFSNPL